MSNWLGWQASKSQRFPCLCLQMCPTMTSFLNGCRGLNSKTQACALSTILPIDWESPGSAMVGLWSLSLGDQCAWVSSSSIWDSALHGEGRTLGWEASQLQFLYGTDQITSVSPSVIWKKKKENPFGFEGMVWTFPGDSGYGRGGDGMGGAAGDSGFGRLGDCVGGAAGDWLW